MRKPSAVLGSILKVSSLENYLGDLVLCQIKHVAELETCLDSSHARVTGGNDDCVPPVCYTKDSLSSSSTSSLLALWEDASDCKCPSVSLPQRQRPICSDC